MAESVSYFCVGDAVLHSLDVKPHCLAILSREHSDDGLSRSRLAIVASLICRDAKLCQKAELENLGKRVENNEFVSITLPRLNSALSFSPPASYVEVSAVEKAFERPLTSAESFQCSTILVLDKFMHRNIDVAFARLIQGGKYEGPADIFFSKTCKKRG